MLLGNLSAFSVLSLFFINHAYYKVMGLRHSTLFQKFIISFRGGGGIILENLKNIHNF